MSSVVHRFSLRGVSQALNQWTSFWRERQRFKILARRLGLNGQGGVARAWRQWRSLTDQLSYHRGIAGRFANIDLVRGFNRWLEKLQERGVMRRFLRRSMNVDLARGFTHWCGMAGQGKRDKARMIRFGSKFLMISELRAFNCWLELMDDLRRMKVFARRMLTRSVLQAFNRWVEMLDEKERLQRLMSRALSPLLSAFDTWRDSLEMIARLRK
eukprot:CAMPEP_0174745050 /NCGR_PEP_ID=MMETSP1094-20130205/85918_1 /TAXON_ID=156173 /ORGANISM="Chrysochromulina brevifilum, Strain UTEX LB 985" /LENGTH=212 /DNA_ID=CAMNT_0015949543 /DNA_START=24 /DNA_END=659 /DNA_ORIENTATION=+